MPWFQVVGSKSNLDMNEESVDVPLYLPYLTGERSPFHHPHARGAFLGLDRSHGTTHLRRAVLEGVALAIRHTIDALRSVDEP